MDEVFNYEEIREELLILLERYGDVEVMGSYQNSTESFMLRSSGNAGQLRVDLSDFNEGVQVQNRQ